MCEASRGLINCLHTGACPPDTLLPGTQLHVMRSSRHKRKANNQQELPAMSGSPHGHCSLSHQLRAPDSIFPATRGSVTATGRQQCDSKLIGHLQVVQVLRRPKGGRVVTGDKQYLPSIAYLPTSYFMKEKKILIYLSHSFLGFCYSLLNVFPIQN